MSEAKLIGAVLFEGFELLDVFGPLEAFGIHANSGKCRVATVAQAAGPIASAQKARAVVDYAFAECPRLDIMLVPGGIGTRREVSNRELHDFLRARAADAEIVSSVCTGAAVLASAGLLDGRKATTNKRAFQWVAGQGPNVTWIKQARWVSDGKFWTSSGVSAGIDMALAIIAQLSETATAEAIATAMEYEWHRNPAWDPFAKVHGLV